MMFFCHLFCFFVVVLSFLLHLFSLCSSAESIKRGTRETKKKQTLQTKKLELKNKTKDSPVKCEDQKKKNSTEMYGCLFFSIVAFAQVFEKSIFFFLFPFPMKCLSWNDGIGLEQINRKKETKPFESRPYYFLPTLLSLTFYVKRNQTCFLHPTPVLPYPFFTIHFDVFFWN